MIALHFELCGIFYLH